MYSLLPALVSIYFLVVAYYLWRKTDILKRPHKAFLLLCITTFFWQATWAILFQTSEPILSESLARFGYLLILFLPTSLYQLLAELSDSYKERRYINLSYFFCGILTIFLLTTDLFIDGYYQYFWGHYPKAGSLHWIHVLQTIIVVLRGLFVASQVEKNAQEPKKSILKCCKISVFIYFLAASDYLCNYGIEFYPLGIVFVASSLSIIGYAMIKKDLFNIRAVISRTASRLIVCGAIVLSFLIINGFEHQLSSLTIIANSCMGVILAINGERLCRALQTAAEKKWITDWYSPTDVLSRLMHLQNRLEKQSILEGVARILKDSMSIKSTSIYAFQNKNLFLLDQDKKLTENQLKKVENLLLSPRDVLHGREIGLDDKSLVLVMRSFNHIEGVIVLSSRFSETPYNSDDIKLLATVSHQSKIFLDNAIRHEEKLKYIKSLAGSIAHEMRNPLSQIHGAIHLLKNNNTSNHAEFHTYYEDVIDVIKNSHQIIDITMDAINEKPVNKQKFQLVSAVDICHEAVSSYAYKDAGLRNKVSVLGSDFQILVDPVLVKYILYNLIGNALYYVQHMPKAEIVISTFLATRQIQVRDTGPGIAPENLSKLFDSFYTSGKSGGTGLGLAYCKRTMQALDGEIYCESVLGEHTAFRMSFPDLAVPKQA
jgi:nitrogen-specific signal transduction histidine kinase